MPTVFNPKLFYSSEFLVRALDENDFVTAESSVLDLGTGSGVAAVAAARCAKKVVAVDSNSDAVRCARINVLLNRVEGCVEVRHGDLFRPVAGQTFDLVLFNPPFLGGSPADAMDRAFRSNDIASRFASELGFHLKSNGVALVVLSSRGLLETFLREFRLNSFNYQLVVQRDLFSEVLKLFRLRRSAATAIDNPPVRKSSSRQHEESTG